MTHTGGSRDWRNLQQHKRVITQQQQPPRFISGCQKLVYVASNCVCYHRAVVTASDPFSGLATSPRLMMKPALIEWPTALRALPMLLLVLLLLHADAADAAHCPCRFEQSCSFLLPRGC
jgi:hypothetical protein